MRKSVYFSVNVCGDISYLQEKNLTFREYPGCLLEKITNRNGQEQVKIIDLLDDNLHSLQDKFDWGIHMPKDIGCYKAVVEYFKTAEGSYRFRVISCTAFLIIG